MKKYRLFFTTWFAFTCISNFSFAQQGKIYIAPEIGKPVPDYVFNDVDHFGNRKRFSTSAARGKWLFIDFWNSFCSTCIDRFPEVNALAAEFKDQIQFMLVAPNSTDYFSNIKKIYSKIYTRLNLALPCAYDSLIYERWEISGVPHFVMIDPNGIVRVITGGRDTTPEKIRDLLAGKPVSFFEESDAKSFDRNQLYLDHGNGGEDTAFLFRSILASYNMEEQSIPATITSDQQNARKGRFQGTMMNLQMLYMLAYVGSMPPRIFRDSLYGRVFAEPVLEMADTTLFDYDYGGKSLKGLYDYSLCVPPSKATAAFLMNCMQTDLKKYFGYDVSIENRQMPCWNLVVIDSLKSKLLSRGGEIIHSSFTPTGIQVQNVPIKEVLEEIITKHELEPPFFDATGLNAPIDLHFEAMLNNLDDVRRALRETGLDLVPGKREMTVVVIRDPKK